MSIRYHETTNQLNQKVGPVLEVTTSYLQGKHGVEIGRMKTILTRGQNFSWLEQIGHRLDRQGPGRQQQETSEMQFEDYALKSNARAFASRSKAKAKPRRPTSVCSSTRTVPFRERIWIDIEPGDQFDQAYPVAKRINTLLRHRELLREEDCAIEFWRMKDDVQNNFEYSQYWSDDVWKSKMTGGGGNNKRFLYCIDS